MKITGFYDYGHINIERNINSQLVHLKLVIAGWKRGPAIG